MSSIALILILVALCVASFCVSMICHWAAGRITRAPNVNMRSAAKIVGWSLFVSIPFFGLLFWTERTFPDTIGPPLFLLIVMIVIGVGIVKMGFGARIGKSVLIWLLATVFNWGAGYAIALPLRAYMAEAFVSPSGGMATTIEGTRTWVTCENCGYEFVVSQSHRIDQSTGLPRSMDGVNTSADCALCGTSQTIEPDTALRSGDRVLVDKMQHIPNRWDIAVFRYPGDPRVNYIQRVVALPGEEVWIEEGDVWVDGDRLRKEPNQQQDMWIPVTDSSFPRKEVLDRWPRWEADDEGNGWRREGDAWVVDSAEEDSVFKLNGEVTNRLAYNPKVENSRVWQPAELPTSSVGDVKLVCTLSGVSGDGQLQFVHRFQGVATMISISADGTVATLIDFADELSTCANKLPAALTDVRELAFVVRDRRCYLLVDGQPLELLDLVGMQEPDEDAKPVEVALRTRELSLRVERLKLYRDVYYVNPDAFDMYGPDMRGSRGNSQVLGPREYFTLGDNSQRSADSRFWGAVPEENMIGVARWIYWPLSRWHEFE